MNEYPWKLSQVELLHSNRVILHLKRRKNHFKDDEFLILQPKEIVSSGTYFRFISLKCYRTILKEIESREFYVEAMNEVQLNGRRSKHKHNNW